MTWNIEKLEMGLGQAYLYSRYLYHRVGTVFVQQAEVTNLLCVFFLAQAKQYVHTLAGSRLGVGLLGSETILPPFGHYWQQRIRLSEPGNYSVVMPTLNPEDQNSVVNVFFQVSKFTYTHLICGLVRGEGGGSLCC